MCQRSRRCCLTTLWETRRCSESSPVPVKAAHQLVQRFASEYQRQHVVNLAIEFHLRCVHVRVHDFGSKSLNTSHRDKKLG